MTTIAKNFFPALVAAMIMIIPSCNRPGPVYEADWESLSAHNKEPDWFADAKLGIYFHWGVYSVPAFDSEWYPRWMYFPNREGWGGRVYAYHVENFGEPSEFNYHDFIPMFRAEHFDPAEWADLFQTAGARFAGPVAQHHDGFAMWASEMNPWNAGDKGPKRDILGELYGELAQRDMRTIATFHHARNLQRYEADSAKWGGDNSHYPYDPEYATSTTDPELRYLYGNIPEDEFYDYWLKQVNEVVDKYSPDIIWFDSWLDQIPEETRKVMVAHQFNAGVKAGKETLVAFKQEDLPRNVGVLDIEQGGMKDISPDYWLTDITISFNSWCYVQDQRYKDAALVIRNMIDVWSKKGIVLLNVSPRADGIIPDEQRAVLERIGVWMDRNAEAVYGTRTHEVYGYGEAEIEEGHFGGQAATIEYGPGDIRFTRSKEGKRLYIFCLGQPEAGSVLEVRNVMGGEVEPGSIRSVSLLGSDAGIDFSADESLLSITIPRESELDEIANVFKVELKRDAQSE